jgi:hypothetical protein
MKRDRSNSTNKVVKVAAQLENWNLTSSLPGEILGLLLVSSTRLDNCIST